MLFNDGHGSLLDVSDSVGCVGPPDGEGFSVALWDFDMDGDQDVFWTNDFRADTLCRNNGSGHFEDVSLPAMGLLGATGAMGAAVGDLDGDACPELYSTNAGRDLILSPSGGLRVDSAYDSLMAGEQDTSLARSGWGVSMFDADYDGDLDVATVSAWLPLPQGGGLQGGLSFYYNRREADGMTLVDQGWAANDLFNKRLSGYGLASGDYDGDGDVDMLLGLDPSRDPKQNGPSGPLLLENISPVSNQHLAITLRQPAPNTRAVGALVVVSVGGFRTAQVLSAGGSFLSANSQTLRFGLGQYAAPDWVAIRWPGEAGWEIRTDLTSGSQRVGRSGLPCVPAGSCAGIEPTTACNAYTGDRLDKATCPDLCAHVANCGWLGKLDMESQASCDSSCAAYSMSRTRASCTLAQECSAEILPTCWE